MPQTQPLPDRRSASKAARRQAIIEAALSLARERGRDGFSVEELAEHAGVSRRTVFNYFGSLNEILVAAAHAQVMVILVEDFDARSRATPPGDGSITSVFEEIVHLLRGTELVGPMSTLVHLLGGLAEDDPMGSELVREVMHRTIERLAADVARRATQADPLEIDLLVHSLFHGIVVINGHWTARTGAVDTPESRETWTELLERLIKTVRDGYRPRSANRT